MTTTIEGAPPPAAPVSVPSDIDEDVSHFEMEPNRFNIYRQYTFKPQTDPEDEIALDALCDTSTLATARPTTSFEPRSALRGLGQAFIKKAVDLQQNVFVPFLNVTTYRLISWFYNASSVKSVEDLDRLIDEVLHAEDFNMKHLENFGAARELKRLNDYTTAFDANDNWKEGFVRIRLPKENVKYKTEADAPEFEVSRIYYRPLLEVIKAAYMDISARQYHFIPHKLFW
ncbi:hypothetical protein SCP_0800400 [Sparassis crispa]|uniref:Uncharacterized protein n=1 Tax=Sparassis crispa TaxID=139825 RepID=A0A401GTL9_9APHY|nr:hypothetical protein SCP_0800400 [Sparassis crispa]GBE85523.1 hypothetical protein SCP_0800400 [Sparassis crispa]